MTLSNFPAMGNGASNQCVFSTVDVVVTDASGTALATKSVPLSIAIGHDNSATITVP